MDYSTFTPHSPSLHPHTSSQNDRPGPAATVAINGGANAGILAAKILAASDEELLGKLKAYSEDLKEDVEKKAEKLEKIGYKEYLAQK